MAEKAVRAEDARAHRLTIGAKEKSKVKTSSLGLVFDMFMGRWGKAGRERRGWQIIAVMAASVTGQHQVGPMQIRPSLTLRH